MSMFRWPPWFFIINIVSIRTFSDLLSHKQELSPFFRSTVFRLGSIIYIVLYTSFVCFGPGGSIFLLWLLYIVSGRKSKISLRSHEQKKTTYESCFPLEQDVLVPPRWHKRQTMDLEFTKCSKNTWTNARKNQMTKWPKLVFNESIGVFFLEKRRCSVMK